jgi:hypothetical protein
MIEPRAVAILRVGLTALQSNEPDAHRLLTELVADLDADGLCRVVETMVVGVVDLLDRLAETDPGFDSDGWIAGLGLVAAGAP